MRLIKDNKNVEIEMNVQNNFYSDDLTGYNLVAEIPGTDPALKSQVVMLGGHLDSWAGGTKNLQPRTGRFDLRPALLPDSEPS